MQKINSILCLVLFIGAGVFGFGVSAMAAVIPIGEGIEKHGIIFKPLFIQAVKVVGEIPKDLQKPGGPKYFGGDPAAMKDMKKDADGGENKATAMDGHAGHHGRGDADMHLELSIHAAKNNPHGFKEGSWVPYLKIFYEIQKKGNNRWFTGGTMIPMASADGPHYGDNAKLNGPGKYIVKFSIWPPNIPYHTDKETGVTKWWTNFQQKWEFSFFGAGKKGGY
jgi:uncharacterized protein involved in high-affinity Fe2+ transport